MKSTYRLSRFPLIAISVCCIIGIGVSIYAYHVETSAHSDPTYKALCDISESMSCSKVFSSRYGKGFGLVDRVFDKDNILNQPNSVFGMLFYLLNALLAFNTKPWAASLQLTICVLGAAGCAYLAVVLFFILQDFCVVCVSTYILNGLILLAAGYKYRTIQRLQSKRGEKMTNGSKKHR